MEKINTEVRDRNNREIHNGDTIRFYLPDTTVEPVQMISEVSYFEGMFIVSKLNDEPLSLRDAIKLSNSKECGFRGAEVVLREPMQ